MSASRQSKLKNIGLSIALLGSSAFVGCGQGGPSLAPVTGTVFLDGQPLEGVMVEFQPKQDGRPSIGYTDESGIFKLRYSRDKWGAIPGEYVVNVSFDYEEGGDQIRPKFKIPKRYNSDSELSSNVVRGKNKFEYELESDKSAPAKSKKVASR